MANILGIPSPKEDIDGNVYYEEHDLERIIQYCKRDVITVAQIFLRLWNDAATKLITCASLRLLLNRAI
jgi:hypothetical protein